MMEKPLLRFLRENFKFFGGLSALYGIIYAFCVYRNSHGATFPLYVIATIAVMGLFMKKINFVVKRGTIIFLIGMLVLSVVMTYTVSTFFIIFNWLGILLLFIMAMIHQFYDSSAWGFPRYFSNLFLAIATTIGYFFYPFKHGSAFLSRRDNSKKKAVAGLFVGILIALGLLSVILPLLLSSDMMFEKIFGEVLKHINFWSVLGVLFVTITGFTVCYSSFSAFCTYNLQAEGREDSRKFQPVVAITFSTILAVIYLFYCVIQILYLFLGLETGLPVGETFASYAKAGFMQLLFVSIINFILVIVCMYCFKESKALKVILAFISGCTFIMMFSAAYRMAMYIITYHLTFYRLLVLWFLIVLAFIMVGTMISIFKGSFPLFRYVVLVVSVSYILFAMVRPNYWVAKYNVAHSQNMSSDDLEYLMTELGEDATAVIATIDPDNIVLSDYSYYRRPFMESGNVREGMYLYFESIVENNQGIYFRKANYTRIRARQVAERYLEEHKTDRPNWRLDGDIF